MARVSQPVRPHVPQPTVPRPPHPLQTSFLVPLQSKQVPARPVPPQFEQLFHLFWSEYDLDA